MTIILGGNLVKNICVAHRGYSSVAPENTMAAFLLAMEQPQVQWIELDVQMSRDGVPVVIHDFSLERTTNGEGLVRETDRSTMASLDAGSWKSKQYAGERIPTLAEVLDRCCGKVRLNIELKTVGNMYPDLPEAVIREVKKRHMQNDVVLTSFEPTALIKAKEIDPGIRTGLIIDAYPADLPERLQEMKCSFLSIGHSHVNRSMMNDLRSRGIQVMAWTVDDPAVMQQLAAVDPEVMICTNDVHAWQVAFRDSHDRFIKR